MVYRESYNEFYGGFVESLITSFMGVVEGLKVVKRVIIRCVGELHKGPLQLFGLRKTSSG